ncbi:MAG: hypothetical protein ABMA15_03415 [Vicinamibacterales bacterium]
MRAEVAEDAKADLGRLGITEESLKAISKSPLRHVEVEVHDDCQNGRDSTTAQRAAASLPWEFVLSAATGRVGRSEPLLVTRVLRRPVSPPLFKPSTFLFVQSAPGRLDGFYEFESERARLRAATAEKEQTWRTSGRNWRLSDSETLERITQRIQRSAPPQAIHVSGIDNHQAATVISGFYDEDAVKRLCSPAGPDDGMVVRGTDVPEQPVPFDVLAGHIVPPGFNPWLISLNLYYSSRIGQEFVRRGAFSALGFQDQVDDEIAELFFQVFYRVWLLGADASDLPRAFGQAWSELREEGHDVFGTGIVLWLAGSAFDRPTSALRSLEEEPEPVAPALPTPQERAATSLMPIADVLQVDLRVSDTINYSLLHNARPFLEKLTLNKLVDHSLDNVSVVVDLNVGDGSLPFRHTELLLDSPQRSLAELVQVPLTAPLLRSLRERVQSTLYAKVMWGDRVAYERTRSVTLLPVDEWFDDTQQNPWLPSFVLPRDPAVTKIISVARRHLTTLLDDTRAGFDGYQSIDDSDDPSGPVDLQVQAIWAALVQEFKLLYVNPPPAYSDRTQRLRTPSEVLSSNSGTCVDLALLLAACLEYIDVYPVVVLLSGHAFVGYWRSDEAHDAFRRVDLVPASVSMDVGVLSRASTISLVDPFGWRLGTQQYAEICQYLRQGRLRFLEATGLCLNYSFEEAIEEGAANMRSPEDFDSLLDIRLARRARPQVTPLPILGSGPAESSR